jgi:Spy/CpxP family protein refolding chaperone
MLHRNEAGWANSRVIIILAVVFLSGSVFGAAAMRQYLHTRFHLPAAHDFLYHGQRVGFENLKATLNLTPDQESTVKQVLDDFAKYYQNLEEQREDVAEAGKRRIFAVLTPDQKRRFNDLFHD